jgi:hypothetical protein
MNIDKKVLKYFIQAYTDAIVDEIEESEQLIAMNLSVQEADLCWHYLVQHYYKKNPIAEA